MLTLRNGTFNYHAGGLALIYCVFIVHVLIVDQIPIREPKRNPDLDLACAAWIHGSLRFEGERKRVLWVGWANLLDAVCDWYCRVRHKGRSDIKWLHRESISSCSQTLAVSIRSQHNTWEIERRVRRLKVGNCETDAFLALSKSIEGCQCKLQCTVIFDRAVDLNTWGDWLTRWGTLCCEWSVLLSVLIWWRNHQLKALVDLPNTVCPRCLTIHVKLKSGRLAHRQSVDTEWDWTHCHLT
jgi:hypothetical protein